MTGTQDLRAHLEETMRRYRDWWLKTAARMGREVKKWGGKA